MVIKLVTSLRLGLSHLREHKFRHSFQDTLNLLCNCGMGIESSILLQCPSYINERPTLMSNLNLVKPQISQTSLQPFSNTLLFLFSFLSYGGKTNTHILNTTIDCIGLTRRFNETLVWIMRFLFFFRLYFWQIYYFV